MADKMMMDEGEMDSLYGDGEETPKKEAETVDQEEAENDSTALVPMKVLQGSSSEPLKEGEEIVVKVVKTYGDEVEIAYSKTKPGEIGAGEDKSANEEIDSMSNSGPGY